MYHVEAQQNSNVHIQIFSLASFLEQKDDDKLMKYSKFI